MKWCYNKNCLKFIYIGGMLMGLLLDYMIKYALEFQRANFNPTRQIYYNWFGSDKRAIKRSGHDHEIVLGQKSAVVVIGVSGTGKTTLAKEILEKNSEMAFISYDDAGYQYDDEVRAGSKKSDERIVEIIEERLMENKDRNVVIDSNCVNPANRAALFRFLRDMGYEISVAYIPAVNRSGERLTRRAVEQVLFQDYLRSIDCAHISMRELMPIRERIIPYMAEKCKMDEEELISETKKRTETLANTWKLQGAYDEECARYRVEWQEKRELFQLGADYFYQF